MMDVKLIQAAPVARDVVGEWIHPGLPEFDEGDSEKWRAWLVAQGLEIKRYQLEDEPIDHPVYVSYFEDGDGNFADWQGAMPSGDGWFTLAVYDTEDGPTWCWARRVAQGAETPKEGAA